MSVDQVQLQQIVELTKQIMQQHQQKGDHISKVISKMAGNKDISKHFQMLSQCITQGFTNPENQTEDAQNQLAKIAFYLVLYCKSQTQQKHFEGVEDLAAAIVRYGHHVLHFLEERAGTLSPSSMEQFLSTFQNIFTLKRESLESINVKLFQVIRFSFQSEQTASNVALTFNEKPLIDIVNQINTIDGTAINRLFSFIGKIIDRNDQLNEVASFAISILFDLLGSNKQFIDGRVTTLLGVVASNKRFHLWNTIIEHPFFETSIEATLQFTYRLEHLVESPNTFIEGTTEKYNEKLTTLERLSADLKPQQFGKQLIRFIDFFLGFILGDERISMDSFIKILRNCFLVNKAEIVKYFNESVYNRWIQSTRQQNHSAKLQKVLLDFFLMFTEQYNGTKDLIMAEIRTRSFSNLSAQIVGSMMLRLVPEEAEVVMTELQAMMIQAESVNGYCFYFYHLMLFKFPRQAKQYFIDCYTQITNRPISEKSIALIFSMFQVMTDPPLRQAAKLVQLLKTETLQVWDVCAILGYQGAKRTTQMQTEERLVLNMAEYLNVNLNGIASLQLNHNDNDSLQRQLSLNKQLCINGFYQIVIFFTHQAIQIDSKFTNSTFLVYFETVQTAMCVRNKTLNYNKLHAAVKLFQDTKTIDSHLRLYILLLKINYLYGAKKDLKELIKPVHQDEPPLEFGSEISSEMGMEAMIDEEQEKQFKGELLQQMGLAAKYLVSWIASLEQQLIVQLCDGFGISCYRLIELVVEYMRCVGMSSGWPLVSIMANVSPIVEPLISDHIALNFQNEISSLSQMIMSNLYHSNITPFATTLIQLFTHPGEDINKAFTEQQSQTLLQLRIAKLILAEMINLDRGYLINHLDADVFEFQLRSYNLYFLIRQQPQLKDWSDLLKQFKLEQKLTQFNNAYKRYCLHLEIARETQSLPSEHIANCRQLLVAVHNQTELDSLAMLCAILLRIDYNFNDCRVFQPNILTLKQIWRGTDSLPSILNSLLALYGDCRNPVDDWVRFLRMLHPLLKVVAVPLQQVMKKRKKSKSKTSMEVEATTMADYLQYPEKGEQMLDSLRFAFHQQCKLAFTYDRSILEQITLYTINNVYRQSFTCKEQAIEALSTIVNFLELFLVPDLYDTMIHIVMYLANECLVNASSSQDFIKACYLLDHARQLLLLLYQNKTSTKPVNMEPLTMLFSRGFNTIIQLQYFPSEKTEHRDQLQDGLAQFGFLLINFMKHLEKELPSESKPPVQVNHQQLFESLGQLLQDQTPAAKEACTFKRSTDEHQKQHFFRCRNCPSHQNKLMEVQQSIDQQICVACAHQCHVNHEGLEYDAMETGFCDCGSQAQGNSCKCVVEEMPQMQQALASGRGRGRPRVSSQSRVNQIYDSLCSKEERDMMRFRDLVQKMESRMSEREELPPPLPARWELPSGSESEKSIKDSSSSSSPQQIEVKSPKSPNYAGKAPVQSQRRSKEKKKSESRSASVSFEEDDEPAEDELMLINESHDSVSFPACNIGEEALPHTDMMMMEAFRMPSLGARMSFLKDDRGDRPQSSGSHIRRAKHALQQHHAQLAQLQQQTQAIQKAPSASRQNPVGSDVESLYPSDIDKASVASSSFLGHHRDMGSSIGRGNEIEEELQVYRGISWFFSNRESDIYQAVMLGLQEMLQKQDINEVVKVVQQTLFAVCKSCLTRYVEDEQSLESFGAKQRKESIKSQTVTHKDNGLYDMQRVNETYEIPTSPQNNFLLHKSLIKTEPIELFNELKRQQDHLQQRQQIIQVPFQIRHMIDYNGEQHIALAGQTSQGQSEIRILDKSKFVKSLVEGSRSRNVDSLVQFSNRGPHPFRQMYSEQLMVPNFQLSRLTTRFPLASVHFNPRRPRELLACGLSDIMLMTLKKDGTSEGQDKPVITRSQHLISKVTWVAEQHFAYLAWSQVVLMNNDKTQLVFCHAQDEKLKDFCIMPQGNEFLLLAFDFYGNVFQQVFNLRDQNKIMLVNILKFPENLKGKNKTSFGIQALQQNLVLISYKNGNSFLCQLQELNKQFVIKSSLMLDTALLKQKVDINLLCNPQVASSSRETITFTCQMLRQSHVSNQMSFHRGQLGIFELTSKGLRFQILEGEQPQDKSFGNGIVDSYIILQESPQVQIVLAILDGRLVTYVLGKQGIDWTQELNEDRVQQSIKQEAQPQVPSTVVVAPLQKQLKDVLTRKVLHLCKDSFKCQQDFALKTPDHTMVDLTINGTASNSLLHPSFPAQTSYDSDQKSLQFKIQLPKSTIITGVQGIRLQFGRVVNNLEIVIEEAREIRRPKFNPGQMLNVPLTPLETLYSIVHSELCFRVSGECEGFKVMACYVHLGELRQLQQKNTSQRLVKLLQSIDERDGQQLESAIRSTHLFQQLDARVRENYLKTVVESPFTATLLNCLDMVSMSLLASRQALQFEHNDLVVRLIKMLSTIIKRKFEPESVEDKFIAICSKRLLKIILTAYRLNGEESSRIILGHELDYKTINDTLFIEYVVENFQMADNYTICKYLKKLIMISDKRFPQIFLFFAKYPKLLGQIADKVCVPENESQPHLQECLQMLVRMYIFKYQFELNKHDRQTASRVFEEIGLAVDNFSVPFQSQFQAILHAQLVNEFKAHHKKEQKTNCYDYALDVYKIAPLTSSAMEIEKRPDQAVSVPQLPPRMPDVPDFDYMDEEEMLKLTLEMSKHEFEGFQAPCEQQVAVVVEQSPKPTETWQGTLPRSTHLTVHLPDVYEGFIQWVTSKIAHGLCQNVQSTNPNTEKEGQCLVLMVHTLFMSLRSYSKLRAGKQGYHYELVTQLWDVIVSNIKELAVQRTTQVSKNPDFSIKLLVILLIYGHSQLNQTKDPTQREYEHYIQPLFANFSDTVLNHLIALQEIFANKGGSLWLLSQRANETAQKPKQDSYVQLKREEHEFARYINYRQSINALVKTPPPQEVITNVKKCKAIIKELIKGQEGQEIGKIFEMSDQVVYVYLTKILLSISKKYQDYEQINKATWGAFICRALLNPITRHLASAELKQILSAVMKKEEYYRVKDFNLYRTELEHLGLSLDNMNLYKNQKVAIQALKMLAKIAKKRPAVWRNFHDEDASSILVIKQALLRPACTPTALQLIDLLQ